MELYRARHFTHVCGICVRPIASLPRQRETGGRLPMSVQANVPMRWCSETRSAVCRAARLRVAMR